MRSLLATCTELMTLMQQVPQPVVARVHGLATAAGCQLVASADLAVASEDAGFAAPGGKGGWFCHTPMVAVARNVGRKRAAELALSGDVIDARTALDWGLVNRVVPAGQLDSAVQRPAGAGHQGVGAEQGHRQAGAVRPDRPGSAEGVRLRHRGHGRDQPAARGARVDARLPGEAQAELGPWPFLGLLPDRDVPAALAGERLPAPVLPPVAQPHPGQPRHQVELGRPHVPERDPPTSRHRSPRPARGNSRPHRPWPDRTAARGARPSQ